MTLLLATLALVGCKPDPVETDPPTPPTPEDSGPIEVTEVSAPVCADPGLREDLPPFVPHTLPDATEAAWVYVYGGGIAAEDLDGDGQHELITVRDGTMEYLDWNGTSWDDRSAELPTLDATRGFGAAILDLDLDGDLDVHVTRWGLPNHVLLNDGTGRFTAPPGALGLAGPARHHSGATSFADIDADGDLDLLVAGHGFIDEELGDPSQFEPGDDTLVYENQGPGIWVPRDDVLPEGAMGTYTFLGSFVDFDVDGDPDLLMVNDFGRRYRACQLLWNDGTGHYTEDLNQAGLDLPYAGMGLAIAELNDDGRPDILMPYWAGYSFMMSAGNLWAEYSPITGLEPGLASNQTVGWGAMFGDLDNNGGEDAVVMHGWLDTVISDNNPVQPDALFQKRGARWVNVTQEWVQVDTGDNRGVVVADFDGDGWLDYARPDLTGPTRVYMGRCGSNHWLEIALDQPGPNPRAIGAVIEVIAGENTVWRMISGGGEGLGSSAPAEQHFGLREFTEVDVRVTWPDGVQHTVETVQTDRRIRIRRRDLEGQEL